MSRWAGVALTVGMLVASNLFMTLAWYWHLRPAKEGAKPEYVILVRLDGNTLLWGVSNAVPVFTELSNFMLEYLRIEPVI